jgi:hypothetical protein
MGSEQFNGPQGQGPGEEGKSKSATKQRANASLALMTSVGLLPRIAIGSAKNEPITFVK